VRLLVVNPNTSTAMTAVIGAAARAAASAGTEIQAINPGYGAAAIDSAMESYLAAVAVMDAVLAVSQPYDAVILAGFGEHGRDGLAELLTVPVFDIAECAAQVAQLVGYRYSVITTLQRSVAAVTDRLRLAGLEQRCASVRACGLGTAAVDADPAAAVTALLAQARIAVTDDHAEVIVLGCGGMAGLAARITAELGVPVIDPVAAGVRIAEAVVGLGVTTSKICSYAPPEPNPISHWPLSEAIGLAR
jgi:allantoin racemase